LLTNAVDPPCTATSACWTTRPLASSSRLAIDQVPGPIARPRPGTIARIAACGRAPLAAGDCPGSRVMVSAFAGGVAPQSG
jgi:hypothetical protein